MRVDGGYLYGIHFGGLALALAWGVAGLFYSRIKIAATAPGLEKQVI